MTTVPCMAGFWSRSLSALALLAVSIADGAHADVGFSDAERALIASHGPWPPPIPDDPGNRYADDSRAIELGARLFTATGLSRGNHMSCRTCHKPERSFADGRTLGYGRARLDRNTPSLYNLAWSRWFGWGGGADSLWAQSIRPIVAEREMNADAGVVRGHLLGDPAVRDAFAGLFRRDPGEVADEELLSLVGKLLAAYQRTLITPRTAFDDFRDALVEGRPLSSEDYPEAAKRGLRLFVGRGRCSLCHLGPAFTSGEFASVGIPHLKHDGEVDRGRLEGMRAVRASVYNLAGPYNDDAAARDAAMVKRLRFRHDSFGEFKVPGLRGVAGTAPYMHDGSLAGLEEVVRHYSEPDMSRFHGGAEGIIRPLRLDDGEVADLVSFLETLGDHGSYR